MVAFLNSFVTYLVIFVLIAALCVGGAFIGIFLRKMKNKQDEIKAQEAEENKE